MDITLWTGLLSFITEYSAMLVITIFIVDYFSYRSRKALLMATFYFIPFSVLHLVIADFLLQMFTTGTLHHMTFQHCYSNILLALSIHVFFGFVIFCLNLKTIVLAAVSLIANLQNRKRNLH